MIEGVRAVSLLKISMVGRLRSYLLAITEPVIYMPGFGILRLLGRSSFEGDGVIPRMLWPSSSDLWAGPGELSSSSLWAVKRGLSTIVFSGLKGFVKFVAVIGKFPCANSESVSMLTLLKPSGFTRNISA